VLIVLLVVAAGVGAIAWFYLQRERVESTENILTREVFRGPYEHIVLEQGVVESSSSVEIRCEVKSQSAGGTEILWVVDEGTHVKKGDKLCELDSSALEQDLVQQEIVCNTSAALVVQAENTLSAAEIARTEYLEGIFKQEEQVILSEIFVAEENLRRAQLAFQSTERLAAKGIVTALQLEGDQFAVDKARNELDAAKTKLEVLQKYTKEKMLKTYDSDIATASAKWESEKKSDQLEQEKLVELKEQLEKCTITAPEDGQVVYANINNRFGGSAEFVVEEGASVRERQAIFRLPDPTKMQIKATINESRISLVGAGMPVAIEFDAIRGQTVRGEVTKVNQYAEAGSWRSGNIKEYAAFIDIFDSPPEVRSGMNAEVRIYVEQLEDALQVPVQALYETKGHFFCLVKDGDQWETREVQVGSSNDTFMTVKSGLEEGEEVVLNPRAYSDKLEIPELPDEEPVAKAGKGPRPKGPRSEGLLGDRPGGMPGSDRGGPPGGGRRERAGRGRGGPPGDGGDGQPGMGRGGQAGGGRGGFDPARIFSTLDTDGDGVLSAEELQAIPADRRGRMTAADADGDGEVSREEFTTGMSRSGRRGEGRPNPGGAGE
jgi:multidrug efflux pump subunit AcrA (membrane-fusion protein)